MKRWLWLLSALAGLGLLIAVLMQLPPRPLPIAITQAPDLDHEHQIFDQLLQDIVSEGMVDYAALRARRDILHTYLRQLADSDLPAERDQHLALLLNAYNAFTLALVDEQLPNNPDRWANWSIQYAFRGLTRVWYAHSFTLAGEQVTLDALEHQRIRSFDEPRIHFAVNCASMGCPPLYEHAFTGDTLEAQLATVSHRFANDPRQLRMDSDGQLRVNAVALWFGDDFRQHGGVGNFLSTYVEDEALRQHLRKGQQLHPLPYSWKLNYYRLTASQPIQTPP
ncbi:MAG: DUF547 domain-containing protein [Planctomycetota bacterium]|nr:MAG: DUF547 domain-containing protein [Planctomycetota bacterium]